VENFPADLRKSAASVERDLAWPRLGGEAVRYYYSDPETAVPF